MEQIKITKVGEEFHVEGFPDAVKVLKLEEPKAKTAADLLLHQADLDFAHNCLEKIKGVPYEQDLIRQALWRSAVVHYMKCFGNSKSRFRLVAEDVYRENTKAIELHKHFSNLRNKHLVHDENSWAQSLPGAILNKSGMDHKIAKIVCVGVIADTLDQANYNNLLSLIPLVKQWAVAQFDGLCVELTKDLEAEKYENLLAREGVVYTAPKAEEIRESRKPR